MNEKQLRIPYTRMRHLTPTAQLREAWVVSGLNRRTTLLRAVRSPLLSKVLSLQARAMLRAEERPND